MRFRFNFGTGYEHRFAWKNTVTNCIKQIFNFQFGELQ